LSLKLLENILHEKWVNPLLFRKWLILIPQIIDLAKPVAEDLGLELVAVFHTNQRPLFLRVDIRNPEHDTGLDDCEG